MTEQELREKIKKIVAPYISAWGDDDAIVDSLIANGIGDVTEWKDKATAAELVAQAAANAAIERIEEWKHRAKVAERALYRACGSSQMMLVFLQKAEKELQEERKDEN